MTDPEGVQLVIMMGDATGSGVSQLADPNISELTYRRAVYRMYTRWDREILAVPFGPLRLISCTCPTF